MGIREWGGGEGGAQKGPVFFSYSTADAKGVFASENYLRIQLESQFLVERMLSFFRLFPAFFASHFFMPFELSR